MHITKTLPTQFKKIHAQTKLKTWVEHAQHQVRVSEKEYKKSYRWIESK